MSTLGNEQGALDDASGQDFAQIEPIQDQSAIQAPEVLPEIDIPSQAWNQNTRESWKALHGYEGSRSHLENLAKQWGETQKYVTQQEQARAALEKQFNPFNEMLQPYDQQWAMQGMDRNQGLRQLLSYASELARNPQAGIQQLAQMYGVDLQQLTQEQPWIDPVTQQVMQRMQGLEQTVFQSQNQERMRHQANLAEAVRAFEEARDDAGNLKHPYFREVFPYMEAFAAAARQNGHQFDPEHAYQKAAEMHPEVSKLVAQQAAEKAKAEALKKAQVSTMQTQKALSASGILKGKTGAVAKGGKTIDEIVHENVRRASAKT